MMTIRLSEPIPVTGEHSEFQDLTDPGKRAYFKRIKPGHPNLFAAGDELDLLSQSDSGSEIILLLGPPGVGKTTLSDFFSSRVIKAAARELEKDRGYIPILNYTAPSPGDKSFSWNGYYTDLLEMLGAVPQKNVIRQRAAVQDALKLRRTQIVVVDEAVNMLRHVRTKNAEGNIDVLKSLGAIPGVKFILVGSYDLHSVSAISGQVAWRTDMVHFQRYRKGAEDDERAFRSSVSQLVKRMPLDNMPALDEIADELMLATAGCIGILKITLMRALNRALRNQGEWRMQFLERALPTPLQLQKVLSEAEAGEVALSYKGERSRAVEILESATRSLRKMERKKGG